jgi:hypothetical protein
MLKMPALLNRAFNLENPQVRGFMVPSPTNRIAEGGGRTPRAKRGLWSTFLITCPNTMESRSLCKSVPLRLCGWTTWERGEIRKKIGLNGRGAFMVPSTTKRKVDGPFAPIGNRQSKIGNRKTLSRNPKRLANW